MENETKESESFSKLEYTSCRMEEITTMLWYIYEDYYSLQQNDLYAKANNYDRLGTFLINLHTLLSGTIDEVNTFIDQVYTERKAGNK